jgi:hypothetical protein
MNKTPLLIDTGYISLTTEFDHTRFIYIPLSCMIGSGVDHVAVEPIKAIHHLITNSTLSQKAHVPVLAMACKQTTYIW